MIHSRGASDRPFSRPRFRALLAVVVVIVVGSTGIGIAANAANRDSMLVSVLRVNSGGAAFTDMQGQLWSADTGAVGGVAKTTAQLINGAWDQELFRTQQVGMTSYAMDVPEGGYEMRLYFAAVESTSAPFSVKSGDEVLLDNTDIAAEVGMLTAEVKQLHVEATTEGITLEFSGEGAAIAGIELLQSKRVESTPNETGVAALQSVAATGATDPFDTPGTDSVTEEELGGTTGTTPGARTPGATTRAANDPFGNTTGGDWITEDELGGTTNSPTSGATTPTATSEPDPFATDDPDWITEDELGGTTAGDTDPFGATPGNDWITEEELGGLPPGAGSPTTPATDTTSAGSAGTDPFGATPGNDWITEEELAGIPDTTSPTTTAPTTPVSTQTETTTDTTDPTATRALPKTTAVVGTSAYRMRGAGTTTVDPNGMTWRADNGMGGYLMELPVAGSPVFGGLRVGATGYRLPVLNGSYTLEMSFGASSKGFNAKVEGTEVLSNFSGEGTDATTMTVNVTVVDGVLDIEFDGGNADVAAIELFMGDTGMTTTDDTSTAEPEQTDPAAAESLGDTATAGSTTTTPSTSSKGAMSQSPPTTVDPESLPHPHPPGTPAH